jgi:hypothetical protein
MSSDVERHRRRVILELSPGRSAPKLSASLQPAAAIAGRVVRPGWFDAVGAGDDRLVLEQSGTGNGGIGRDPLAEALIRSSLADSAPGRTFELFAGPVPHR